MLLYTEGSHVIVYRGEPFLFFQYFDQALSKIYDNFIKLNNTFVHKSTS